MNSFKCVLASLFLIPLYAVFASQPMQYGLDLLENPFYLPLLRNHEMTLQVSSHDKRGGNEDGGRLDYGAESYLYKLNTNEFVLFDEIGSGYVGRIWFTKLTEGNIRFYVNGETQPSIDIPLFDFFTGNIAPFLYPLSGDEDVCSGGYISYVPIYFSNRLKITVTSRPYYYNITYKKFSPFADVQSMQQSQEVSNAVAILQNGANVTNSKLAQNSVSKTMHLFPSQQDTLQLSGTGTITELVLQIQQLSGSFVNLADNLWLHAVWDDHSDMDVSAPLTLLFGGGIGNFACQAYLFGSDPIARKCYSYFPMPFENHAQLVVENRSSQTVEIELAVKKTNELPGELVKSCGYFRTEYKHIVPKMGQDMLLFADTGRGHVVGTVMDMRGGIRPTHLEGDEIIYIDDSLAPQLYGTGTEDYFNGGWYFKNGLFSLPFNGFTFEETSSNGLRQICYRQMIADNFNYNRNIKFYMEHGPENDIIADYYVLTFYYHSLAGNLQLSDMLNIGNSNDEFAHNFQADAAAYHTSYAHYYEGISDLLSVPDGGIIASTLNFTMQLQPINSGARLVRRMDYLALNQKAQVYVDGVYAGDWYDAGWNHDKRWRDSYFELSSQLTAGKSKIDITIIADPNSQWSSYTFWLYCYEDVNLPSIQFTAPNISVFISDETSASFPIHVQNTGAATLLTTCAEKQLSPKPQVLFSGWGNTSALPFRSGFQSPWLDRNFEIVQQPNAPASLSQYSQIVLLASSSTTSSIISDSLDTFVENGGVAFVFGNAYGRGLVPIQAHCSAVSAFHTREYLINVNNLQNHDITTTLASQIAFKGWTENVTASADANILLTWENGAPYLVIKKYGRGYMVYISHENAWNSAIWYGDEQAGLQLCGSILDWIDEKIKFEWFNVEPAFLSLEPGETGEFVVHLNPFHSIIPSGRYVNELMLHHNDPMASSKTINLLAHFGMHQQVLMPADIYGEHKFTDMDLQLDYSAQQDELIKIEYYPQVQSPHIESTMATRFWDVAAASAFHYKPSVQLSTAELNVLAGQLSELRLAVNVDNEWLALPSFIDADNGLLSSSLEISGSNRIGYGILSSRELPVELVHFSTMADGDSVYLNWQTASESGNLGFHVQRRFMHEEFQNVGFVRGNGTSAETHRYSFVDYNPQHQNFQYRLQQVDIDGSTHFSETQLVSYPHLYQLYEAYPNPFNSATTISFELAAEKHVSIKIYDMLGRLIDTLIDTSRCAGHYNIHWQAKNAHGENVASGIYFIKFDCDSHTQTRKIILVR